MRFFKAYQDSAPGGRFPPDKLIFRSIPNLLNLFVGLFVVVLLSACVAAAPAGGAASVQPPSDERLSDISSVDLPASEPIIVPDVTAQIITEGSRANIRSGPALDAPILAKAVPGDTFEILGRSEDDEWWLICCVRGPGDASGVATESAWLASVVVSTEGNVDAVPVVEPVLADDVAASWEVVWKCGSERCEVKQCVAQVEAKANEDSSEQWLEVEHGVTWDDACFETDSWVFEVDRYTGRERSGEFIDNFLYNYWLGEQPGPPTNLYAFDDGRKIAVWCSGPHELEIEEGDGWSTLYEGNTCHDVDTGELITLSYTKRWLFSGEYEGQQYERAYFGDYESLEQRLLDTNALLSYVE